MSRNILHELLLENAQEQSYLIKMQQMAAQLESEYWQKKIAELEVLAAPTSGELKENV